MRSKRTVWDWHKESFSIQWRKTTTKAFPLQKTQRITPIKENAACAKHGKTPNVCIRNWTMFLKTKKFSKITFLKSNKRANKFAWLLLSKQYLLMAVFLPFFVNPFRLLHLFWSPLKTQKTKLAMRKYLKPEYPVECAGERYLPLQKSVWRKMTRSNEQNWIQRG